MEYVESTDIRRKFVDIAERVRLKGERIIVRRNGRDLVAIVPVAEAMALMEAAEKLTPRPIDRAAIQAITAELRRMPILDDRPPDQLLGYDDGGLPS
jgi:prevent-host-death family protein